MIRWPAEWEPHRATWIAWPHHEPDWPGKFAPIPWVYAEIVRAIADHEMVEVLVQSAEVEVQARLAVEAHGVRHENVRFHRQPTDRVWLRDSAPTAVYAENGQLAWVNWAFNAWAKYENFAADLKVGARIEEISGHPRVEPVRTDLSDPRTHLGSRLVLEGGGIETDGEGTLLVTEEWLLSDIQIRNPGMSRADYEAAFARELGIRKTIWLGEGCVGDDTHGHIDDIARFVAPGVVVLAHEEDPADANHARSLENLRRLEGAVDAAGRPLRVVVLPFPRAVMMEGERLPASYANFYIANGVVLVPTFNDPNDRIALNRIAELFPDRVVTGIHAVDLVWGLGTLHCLTQQEPVGLDPTRDP